MWCWKGFFMGRCTYDNRSHMGTSVECLFKNISILFPFEIWKKTLKTIMIKKVVTLSYNVKYVLKISPKICH